MQSLKKVFEPVSIFFARWRPSSSQIEISQAKGNSYDLSGLHQLTGGDAQQMIELLQVFLSSADQDLVKIAEASDVNDWDRVAAVAHKLIPSCGYLQLNDLVDLLKEFEGKVIQNQSAVVIKHLIDQVQLDYIEIKSGINEDIRKLKRSIISEKAVSQG